MLLNCIIKFHPFFRNVDLVIPKEWWNLIVLSSIMEMNIRDMKECDHYVSSKHIDFHDRIIIKRNS